jgi:hypothetical protein
VAGDGESGHPPLPLLLLLRPASCALPSSASRSRSAHRIAFLMPAVHFFLLFFFLFFSFFVRGVSIERGKASAFWGFFGLRFLYGVTYITAVTASLRQKKLPFFAAFFKIPLLFFDS